MAGYICEFRDDSGDVVETLGPDEIADPSIPQEHSVISEWEFRTPFRTSLETVRHSSAFIFFEGNDGDRQLIVRGPVDEIKSDDQRGETLVRGRGQIANLLEDGPDNGVILADGPADEEIQSVWGQTEFTADVSGSEADVLSEDLTIQDSVSSFDSDTAVDSFVTGSDIRRARIGWTADAIDVVNYSDGVSTFSDGDYTGGEAVEFGGGLAQTFELDFETEYKTDLQLAVRIDNTADGDNPGFELVLDDNVISTVPEGALVDRLGWFDELARDVSTGSHRFEVRGSGDNTSTDFAVDHLAVYDSDLTETDNEVHEPDGQLNSPHNYPTTAEEIRTTAASVENGSISEATVTTTIDDVSGDQQLSLYVEPDSSSPDFSINNSATLGSLDTPLTTTLQVGVELAATDELRDNKTPREGFEPQRLSEFDLTVTTVDKIVFEGEEFDGNYFNILQAMHSDAGLIFRSVVDEDELRAETFERGAFLDDIEWTRLGYTRGFNTSEFANKVIAVGGEDDDGNRPTSEQDDTDSIDAIGERRAFVVNEQITTSNGIENFAKAELNQRLNKDDFAGEIEIVPQRLKPGYRYAVDAFDGEESVLERVVFDDGADPSGKLIFEGLVDVSAAISGVRDEARRGRR